MKLSLISLFALAGIAAFAMRGLAEDKTPSGLTAATRTEVINAILERLNKSYVFPEIAKRMEEALHKRVQNGEYDAITSGATFAQTLTGHLQEVSHDKHLRVRYSEKPQPVEPTGPPSQEMQARMRKFGEFINFGFEKVERLPGNIGYIDLRGFFDADAAAQTAQHAMNLIANTDALIFDLRQNGGGDPAMVRLLCSYLFDTTPVHLNDLYWREGNRTDEFWTLSDIPGKRYLNKEVYVLTSKRTFSGAEEFTYNLKNLKRATILGETTGGGAHPGGVTRLNDHFSVFIPTGRAINPITKTNWEGTGVKPDVEIPAEQALKTAQVMALRKLLAKTEDPDRKEEITQALQAAERANKETESQTTSQKHAVKGPFLPFV